LYLFSSFIEDTKPMLRFEIRTGMSGFRGFNYRTIKRFSN